MAWSNSSGWTTGSGGWNNPPVASGSPVLFTYNFVTNPSLPTGLSLSRATIGTYIDTSGIRQTAAINAARFDSDWDGAAFTNRGMLVEEQRSNLTTNSDAPITLYSNVGNVAWSTSSTPGADNSVNMATLTAGAGAISDTSFARGSSSPFLVDVDFKKNNWNYVYIANIISGGDSYTAIFDLVNGTSTQSFGQGTSATAGPAAVRRLRNSIFRCGIKGLTQLGYVAIGFAPTATGNTFDSVGHPVGTMAGTETVLVGGTYDDGNVAYHASYIVSMGGVTRSADVVSATGTLATQLTNGPSVWEMEDLATGTISRIQFGNGAFTFPTGKRWRSFGVYPNGTNTAPYTTVGGAY